MKDFNVAQSRAGAQQYAKALESLTAVDIKLRPAHATHQGHFNAWKLLDEKLGDGLVLIGEIDAKPTLRAALFG
ncbi:hypothetical protein H5976_08565, partial [Streptococcus alactolyticus]|uniref:hypothetical protein n=1 Tax=Streptococcus alactolyticus TaxID=29389 RepID=UPI00195612C6